MLMLLELPTRDFLESPGNDDSPEMQASSMPGRRDSGRVGAHAAGHRGSQGVSIVSPDSEWP